MTLERKSFINVDELMPKVKLEQAAAYYGVQLPDLRQVGAETRTRCFLACGRTCETGDRVLAIQSDHPANRRRLTARMRFGCSSLGSCAIA